MPGAWRARRKKHSGGWRLLQLPPIVLPIAGSRPAVAVLIRFRVRQSDRTCATAPLRRSDNPGHRRLTSIALSPSARAVASVDAQVQKLVNNWLVGTSFSIGVADTVADTETIMTIGGIIDTAKRQDGHS